MCNDKGCSDENIETAESRLSHKLLSYLDSDWNGTLTTLDLAEDDAALDFLARNLTSIGDLYTIYPDSELPTIGPEPKRTYTADQIKQALKNYSVNHSDSYNDALENADHLTYLGRGLDIPATSSADFYKERVALPPKNAQLEATTGTIAGAEVYTRSEPSLKKGGFPF